MIRLLSTDFDGTLVDHFAHTPVDPEFFQTLQRLRERGVLWAVNTGRSVHHISEGLEEFHFPLHPDFVLTNEREVFRAGDTGKSWEDYGDWNRRCTLAHAELFTESGPMFEKISEYLARETRAELIYEDKFPVGVVASDDSEMDRIVEFIDQERIDIPNFHYQRNMIYLRFCHRDYHKGAALGELARLLEIPRENIFAAGDHMNDLSMLDGRYAAYSACPSNSVEAVKELVRAAGGYVAKGACSSGVLEAMRHYGIKD